MFTGIIEETGTVARITGSRGARKLAIRAAKIMQDLTVDDSIAVDGVCLTVIETSEKSFAVEVVEESLRRSTLGALTQGSIVNLERALSAASRLGGHFVQGHVDGTAVVRHWTTQQGGKLLTLEAPPDLRKYIIPKGSITVNGVSLTVARLSGDKVSIALIPHTMEVTTLGRLRAGDRVNIETDMLGKYVYQLLEPYLNNSASHHAGLNVKVED